MIPTSSFSLSWRSVELIVGVLKGWGIGWMVPSRGQGPDGAQGWVMPLGGPHSDQCCLIPSPVAQRVHPQQVCRWPCLWWPQSMCRTMTHHPQPTSTDTQQSSAKTWCRETALQKVPIVNTDQERINDLISIYSVVSCSNKWTKLLFFFLLLTLAFFS